MMRHVKRVLAICGDPGGTAALAPVLEKMSADEEWKVEIFAYRHGGRTLEDRGISSTLLPDYTCEEDIAEIFARVEPDVLITTTSSNGLEMELLFLAEAKKRTIPSLSLLEFWANYKVRFLKEETLVLPDIIAVVDETMRQEMMECGFPGDNLRLSGHPALEKILSVRPAFQNLNPEDIREEMGLERGGIHVLFVSQPEYPDWDAPNFEELYWGFSKKTVLPPLVAALEEIAQKHGEKIHLTIRPHSREAEDDFAWVHSSKVAIRIIREGDAKRILRAFTVVTGMNSALLIEACLLGCTVLSLQPERRKPDVLQSNHWGLSIPVEKESAILPELESALFSPAGQKQTCGIVPPFVTETPATDRFLELMRSQISTYSQLQSHE